MDTTQRPSVLLAFRAENVLSFRDEFELSFVATTKAIKDDVITVPRNETGATVDVLRQVALFGANAAGKSNVLKAMAFMRYLVVYSFSGIRPTEEIPRQPFRMDADSRTRPSRFEIEFIFRGVHHQYGFVVDGERVLEEWLQRAPRGRTATLFERDADGITIGRGMGPKRASARELLRDNALLLSTAAATNHPVLGPIYEWFDRNLLIAHPANSPERAGYTAALLESPEHYESVLGLLRAADLGVRDARTVIQKSDPARRDQTAHPRDRADDDQLDEETLIEYRKIFLRHEGTLWQEEFRFDEESDGTQTWFSIVGPLLHVLSLGGVLLLDEIDASLHPALVHQAVRLIQSPEHNRHRAQMVFTTHDTTLLSNDPGPRILGRDQVWFAQKAPDGASELFSLADYTESKDDAWARRYLSGRYGAMPTLADHEFVPQADAEGTAS